MHLQFFTFICLVIVNCNARTLVKEQREPNKFGSILESSSNHVHVSEDTDPRPRVNMRVINSRKDHERRPLPAYHKIHYKPNFMHPKYEDQQDKIFTKADLLRLLPFMKPVKNDYNNGKGWRPLGPLVLTMDKTAGQDKHTGSSDDSEDHADDAEHDEVHRDVKAEHSEDGWNHKELVLANVDHEDKTDNGGLKVHEKHESQEDDEDHGDHEDHDVDESQEDQEGHKDNDDHSDREDHEDLEDHEDDEDDDHEEHDDEEGDK